MLKISVILFVLDYSWKNLPSVMFHPEVLGISTSVYESCRTKPIYVAGSLTSDIIYLKGRVQVRERFHPLFTLQMATVGWTGPRAWNCTHLSHGYQGLEHLAHLRLLSQGPGSAVKQCGSDSNPTYSVTMMALVISIINVEAPNPYCI